MARGSALTPPAVQRSAERCSRDALVGTSARCHANRIASAAVRFSIGLPTDRVDSAEEFVTGDAVMECAAAVEAMGFDACFVTDHPAPDAKWLAAGGHHALDP